MSIWDRLTPRTWEQVEAVYPTWEAIDGKRWYVVMYGYEYTLPILRDVRTDICFIGEPFAVQVDAHEDIEREFTGGDVITVEDLFTGTVAVRFQETEYPLTYNPDTGLYEGTVPGPAPEDWSEDHYTFAYTVLARNDRGETSRELRITAYKALPSITWVSAPDCHVGESFVLEARIVIETIPAGGKPPAFAGMATAEFEGESYPLSETAESGLWAVTLTAPEETSWFLEGHVYAGTLTASSGDESDTASFGVRVRETGAPQVTPAAPAQDIFVCNDCSPQFCWQVSDDISGLAGAEVSLDYGPWEAALIQAGEARWQMPVTVSGPHVVQVRVTDNDGNVTALERTLEAVWLVTDRTEADLQSLVALHAAGWDNLTDAQRREWWHGTWREALHWADGEVMEFTDGVAYVLEGFNRGAYNIEDVNRVETVTGYQAKRITALGLPLAPQTKTDWTEEDIPTTGDMSRYLSNVAALRGKWDDLLHQAYDYYGAFALPPPELPGSMEVMGFEAANAIESLLAAVEKLLDWVESFNWWVDAHARTWEELEADFPTWDDLDGTPWWAVQVEESTVAQLAAPWQVFDPRYPR